MANTSGNVYIDYVNGPPPPRKKFSHLLTICNMSQQKIFSGKWTGDYLDVKGYKGTLEMEIKADGDRISGEFTLTIKDVDAPQVMKGALSGVESEKGLRLSLSMLDNKRQNLELQYDSQVSEGGTFARQALYGIVSAPPKTDLGGGVWMVWNFDQLQK